jgi:hypothetical protein
MKRLASPLLLVLAVVVVGGCGVPGQSRPTQLDETGVQVIVSGSATTRHIGASTRLVELCLVSADHLVPIVTELASPLSLRGTLAALVDSAKTNRETGVRSVINAPNLVTAGVAAGGVATVELHAEFTRIPAADQVLGIAQIVCTLTSMPGIGQVRFTRNGRPLDIPRGDASLTNRPVSRSDYKDFLPGS